jgi:hypothetical protein
MVHCSSPPNPLMGLMLSFICRQLIHRGIEVSRPLRLLQSWLRGLEDTGVAGLGAEGGGRTLGDRCVKKEAESSRNVGPGTLGPLHSELRHRQEE